jgi:hypothetical protein
MHPILIASTRTAGTLYPSLGPTGYDPVLEYDIRTTLAASGSDRHANRRQGSKHELSISHRPNDDCSATTRVIAALGCRHGGDDPARGRLPCLARPADMHSVRLSGPTHPMVPRPGGPA